MDSDQSLQRTEKLKPYQAPQIVLELELEAQAGTRLGIEELDEELPTP